VPAVAGLLSGCASTTPEMRALEPAPPAPPACRALPTGTEATSVAWYQPAAAPHAATLDAWCATVGPPIIALRPEDRTMPAADPERLDELVLVSWNVHVGGADLTAMVRSLRNGALTNGRPVTRFVLLLQEAYRAGPDVPRAGPAGFGYPRPMRPSDPSHERVDIAEHARRTGLSLFYVPSMRNGAPGETDEDRGNAILSTEPITDFSAIELPFERQRRVAAAASLRLRGSVGEAWALRLASVHLESTASAKRLRVLAQEPRRRQVAGLLSVLPPALPMVVGGDFNTWFGYLDRSYKAMASAMPDIEVTDRRPTFARFVRLDHVFSNLPDGWTAMATRLAESFGSDHYPILARVRAPGTPPVAGPR
jgi:endonuclease/exonuclease/phosphatase family metal-dependent hydrolase